MKNTTRLTVQDMISKKLQKDSDQIKFKDIYASKMDGMVLFKIPTDDEIFDVIDEIGENRKSSVIKEVYTKMIYRQCDALHEKELLEAYGVTRGFDIVPILFSTKDIMAIGNELVDSTGIADKDEELKN